jgi:ketosteroid isomerase-like protein
MPANSGHSQQVIADVADQLFAAIERSDETTLRHLFDDDIAVWRTGARHDDDKERALRVLRWFIGATTQRHYEILDRQLFADGFVQQHILHAAGRNGGSIDLRVCIVIRVGVNALISRVDEYFNPADLAPLMS